VAVRETPQGYEVVMPNGQSLGTFDNAGQAHMVDVGGKPSSSRLAVAEGRIRMQPSTLAQLMQLLLHTSPKPPEPPAAQPVQPPVAPPAGKGKAGAQAQAQVGTLGCGAQNACALVTSHQPKECSLMAGSVPHHRRTGYPGWPAAVPDDAVRRPLWLCLIT
jgi:hypothetical protein